jgi:hypothetical protein
MPESDSLLPSGDDDEAAGKSLPSKSTISVYSDNEILTKSFLVLSAMYSIMDDLPKYDMCVRNTPASIHRSPIEIVI